ncbi:uncharacterized protein [Primulina eburnea]|uniref:uncharacterized protein n=1 Tax=Primulina eburnea TaxID=1245227 RepID=UPI003C6C6EE4
MLSLMEKVLCFCFTRKRRKGSAETRMAKCLKLRICSAVASTMQSCRSKEPSTLPQNPDLKHQIPRAYLKHHVSSSQDFEWKEEGKWHVVDKICEKRTPRPREMKMVQDFPPPPFEADRRKRRVKKKKNVPSRLRVSYSSGDSGWFSSEGAGDERDEEETETLVSSNSMNISPANESAQPFSSQHRNNKRRPVASMRRRGTSKPPPEADGEIPARLSMLKKLIPCTVDGKVKESFAVVKKSEDPYEDFKNSMMDMILEKQMFEDKDLEQLLQCFLSLNSRHYHGIIVQAFCEIWDTIFTPSSPHQ